MILKVTCRHLNKGVRSCPSKCVIALALISLLKKLKIKYTSICINSASLCYEQDMYEFNHLTTIKLRDYITKFDNPRERLEPTTFRIKDPHKWTKS